jgi:hypothetical protein
MPGNPHQRNIRENGAAPTEAAGLVDSCSTAVKGAQDYNAKLSNSLMQTPTAFFVQKLFGVSPTNS